MRYLLTAFLLWYAQAAFADDTGISSIFVEIYAEVQNDVCVKRDPDNAASMEKAYTNWKSMNAQPLEEIKALREKVAAKARAHAIDPERKVTMDERSQGYWHTTMPVMASTMFYSTAALTNDATIRRWCAQLQAVWMRRQPDLELFMSREMLQKMLDSKSPE